MWKVSRITSAAALIAAAPVYAQTTATGGTVPTDSQPNRSDPVVIVDGARVKQRTLSKLQGITVTAEILRGENTNPYGVDAAGGVIRITIPVAASAPTSLRALLASMGNGQERFQMGDTSQKAHTGQPMGGAAPSGPPIYPIVIIDGRRGD